MLFKQKKGIIWGIFLLFFLLFSCGEDGSFYPAGSVPSFKGDFDDYEDIKINLLQLVPEARVRIAILGDNRRGDYVFQTLQKIISRMKPSPDLVIHLGDMIDHPGSGVEWYHFHQISEILTERFPFYPVVGNHDVDDEASQEIYQHQFPPPANELYYYLKKGDLLLIFLDSELAGEVGKIAGEQFNWLKNLLENQEAGFKYRLVFLHRPLFPQADHQGESLDCYSQARDKLHQLFLLNGVDAVFSAHEHIYDRRKIDGIVYFISGGAGAPLVDDARSFYHFLYLAETNQGLEIFCFSIDGTMIDQVLIQ